jgi:hemerythrin
MDASLYTGIEEIDRQHKVLFDALDRIVQAVGDKARWAAVHFSLDELSDFVRIHFAVEEALLRMHGYADVESHLAEHRLFSEKLQALREKSLRTDVSEEMITLLRTWLVEHIGKVDLNYVAHLRTAPVVLSSAL